MKAYILNSIAKDISTNFVIFFYGDVNFLPYWGVSLDSQALPLNSSIVFVPMNDANMEALHSFIGGALEISGPPIIKLTSATKKDDVPSCEIAFQKSKKDVEELAFISFNCQHNLREWINLFLAKLSGRVFTFVEL